MSISYSTVEKLRITAYVEPDVYKGIEKQCEKEKRSLSQMVDLLLAEALEARQAKQK